MINRTSLNEKGSLAELHNLVAWSENSVSLPGPFLILAFAGSLGSAFLGCCHCFVPLQVAQ